MKRILTLISLIAFATNLHGFALNPISEARKVKFEPVMENILVALQGKTVNEYSLVTEIDDFYLFVYLKKGDTVDSSAIIGIDFEGFMDIEMAQSDFGDLRRQGIVKQITGYMKEAIPNGLEIKNMVVNEPTIALLVNVKTLEELEKKFLESPVGKIFKYLGFNKFTFSMHPEGTNGDVSVTDENIGLFSSSLEISRYFNVISEKVDLKEHYKSVCDEAGARYIGVTEDEDFGDGDIEEGMVWFNASSGSTLVLKKSEFNLESVKEKLKEHNDLFVKPEVDYKAGVEVEPTLESHENTIEENMRQGILNMRAVLGAI